jgi:uncharacterized membrane protein
VVKFRIEEGETDHISYSGKRQRKKTVLLKIGERSISKKALQLGLILVCCQILDGVLTYAGLSLMGVHMEGNSLLRDLMHYYGEAPVLFAAKSVSILFIALLTIQSHHRPWIRPLIVLLILVYLGLAVIPWTYLISQKIAQEQTTVH